MTEEQENMVKAKLAEIADAIPECRGAVFAIFGGSFENQILARNLARSLTKEYPEATFINPLDNFIYMDRRSEEEILAAERFILAKCELLLLTGRWNTHVRMAMDADEMGLK